MIAIRRSSGEPASRSRTRLRTTSLWNLEIGAQIVARPGFDLNAVKACDLGERVSRDRVSSGAAVPASSLLVPHCDTARAYRICVYLFVVGSYGAHGFDCAKRPGYCRVLSTACPYSVARRCHLAVSGAGRRSLASLARTSAASGWLRSSRIVKACCHALMAASGLSTVTCMSPRWASAVACR